MKKLLTLKVVLAVLISLIWACEQESLILIDETSKSDSTKIVKTDTTKVDTVSKEPIPPVPSTPSQKAYYVSVNGSDSNIGDILKPFRTIKKGISAVGPGEILYIRGGVYQEMVDTRLCIHIYGKNGTAASPITISAYPGEIPIVDGSGLTNTLASRIGVRLENSNYVILKGIDIRNIKQHNAVTQDAPLVQGLYIVDSNNITVEELKSHDNQGIGTRVYGKCNNLIIKNCDFYNNFDPYCWNGGKPNPGGNGDGVLIAVTEQGYKVTIEGCRSWWNSDDGFDSYGSNATIIYKNNWSFWNGNQPGTFNKIGEGKGFKLGPNTLPSSGVVERTVTNCIAAENAGFGYSVNTGTFIYALYNNVSYKNSLGYFFIGNKKPNIFKNNISYLNTESHWLNPEAVQDHNSWNGSVTVDSNDFQSLDVASLRSPRTANGSLPYLSAFRLKAGSDLIGAGTNVGYGINIGAY